MYSCSYLLVSSNSNYKASRTNSLKISGSGKRWMLFLFNTLCLAGRFSLRHSRCISHLNPVLNVFYRTYSYSCVISTYWYYIIIIIIIIIYTLCVASDYILEWHNCVRFNLCTLSRLSSSTIYQSDRSTCCSHNIFTLSRLRDRMYACNFVWKLLVIRHVSSYRQIRVFVW